ncbi:MAG: hypothetical protein CI948_2888 [Halanaerobium sp.]|nr:MAG: hypothetical protein CI948_2888 [Halanaerobium sp.]
MIDGKEIAKLIRTRNNVIIEKFEDGSYNVTDTYVMVKLNEAEFGKFFAKYNSYKVTADIPFNFEGTISSSTRKMIQVTRFDSLRQVMKLECSTEIMNSCFNMGLNIRQKTIKILSSF